MTNRQKKKLSAVLSYAVKFLIGLLFISPLLIGLCFSFQPEIELIQYPLKLIAENPTIVNYLEALRKVDFVTYLKNSFIVCFICIAFQIIFASLTAYALVFFKFRGKALLWTLILSTMMIPGEVTVITNYVTVQGMGLINTFAGLCCTSLISGTAIFMMRQYYMTLPRDFKEAATLDGCSDMGFLFRIAMPLSIPSIASLGVYLFVQIYNAFFWPLLVTNNSQWHTVQIGVAMFVTGDTVNFGEILAGAMITIIPSALIYIFGQDYIIKGMTSGGVKG